MSQYCQHSITGVCFWKHTYVKLFQTTTDWLTYFTYSIEQSPWVANRFSASQEIPHILWNPKVHYRLQKRPPSVPINPVHTPTSHFLNIHLILSFHLRLGLPSGLFPSGFPIKTLYTPLPHTCYMPRPSNFSLFIHSKPWHVAELLYPHLQFVSYIRINPLKIGVNTHYIWRFSSYLTRNSVRCQCRPFNVIWWHTAQTTIRNDLSQPSSRQ
jgi:hypothetical protein